MTLEYDTIESLAARLVQIPSENPPGEEATCAEFIHQWFTDRDIAAELLEEPDPDRPQVGARVGSGAPTLVINGHTDVVPPGDHDAWTDGPYDGVVSDGRLYGRGSADMKTGLAIGMLLLAAFADRLSTGELPGSLVFHAAMGEETGDPGTKTLLEQGYDGDHAIVIEPTSFRVATSSKGLAVYEVTLTGAATHASHPEKGVNPIESAEPVLNAIQEYNTELINRGTGLCGTALASVTEFESGVGSNYGVIPETARFIFDRRIVPGESLESVDAEVYALFDEIAASIPLSIEATRVQHYAASDIPVDDPLAVRTRELSADRAVADTKPWGIEAATDMRNFINDADMPAITWGPGSLSQAHTVDESIDLAEAALGYDLLTQLTEEFLNGAITDNR